MVLELTVIDFVADEIGEVWPTSIAGHPHHQTRLQHVDRNTEILHMVPLQLADGPFLLGYCDYNGRL